jgi:hypothetical protein
VWHNAQSGKQYIPCPRKYLLVLFSLAKLLPFQWEESIALRGSAGEHALFEISVQSQVKLT